MSWYVDVSVSDDMFDIVSWEDPAVKEVYLHLRMCKEEQSKVKHTHLNRIRDQP